MKILKVFVILAAVMLALPAAAQYPTMRANIPFDFQVNNTTLPAGAYQVLHLHGSSDALILWSADGEHSAVVLAPRGDKSADHSPRLIFRRYGSRTFLGHVWMKNAAHLIPQSKSEIEVARGMTSQPVVVLAAK